MKSVYLSTGRFASARRRVRYRGELAGIGRQISEGQTPRYLETELERLRAQRRLAESVPMRLVWGALARLFLPAVLFLAVLYGLQLLVRWLRRGG